MLPLVLAVGSCGGDPHEVIGADLEVAVTEDALFADVGPGVGLEFVHCNGMTGERYFVEPVGSGGALVDLDGDGDLDVVLIQGGPLERKDPTAADPCPDDAAPGHRVFRNDLVVAAGGRRQIRLVDVTADSGLESPAHGMGIATGDVDNDGRVDLYVTAFGPNRLWRNVSDERGIRFVDMTDTAEVDDPRWSTSAAFVDIDANGWLDLYVANYVDFRLANHRPCRSAGGRLDYCGPQAYQGVSDRLFLNRGDGTFDDISGPAGILTEASSGLGVVTADLDQDGAVDIYVANDLRHNILWRQLDPADGVPRFENSALLAGCAVSADGRSQASMGVVAADLDDDGDDDLFMTHLSTDTNTMYLNLGGGVFDDRSAMSDLGPASIAATGFGAASIDVDNDGWLDLVAANGEVRVIESQVLSGDPFPLKQPNQLFRNLGDGSFVEISNQAGPELQRLEVSRGVAVGDVDNDGRADVLVTNNHGPARLLRNQSRNDHSWIGLRVVIGEPGRDALGARLHLTTSGGRQRWRRVATDGSYLSASDPRVVVGLDRDDGPVRVEVRWPDGETERWQGLAPNRYHTLIAGQAPRMPAEESP